MPHTRSLCKCGGFMEDLDVRKSLGGNELSMPRIESSVVELKRIKAWHPQFPVKQHHFLETATPFW